jgi:hypothetical protein
MPRTALTSAQLAAASSPGTLLADPVSTAADTVNGNSAVNSGDTILRVQNTDTAPHTLTLLTPVTIDGLALASDPRVIPASSTQWIGDLPVAVYGSTLNMTADSAQLKLTVFEP